MRNRIVLMLAVLCTMPAQAAIHRSYAAKAQFARQHPCPSTGLPKPSCHGYVIDHIKPLCAGGADKPANMQWQDLTASKRKDSLERRQCAALHK